MPPIIERINIVEYSNSNPTMTRAGMVKITPAAIDSPDEPMVCTILFSSIVEPPSFFRIAIDRTAIGIEALTVRPTVRPR